MWYVFTRDKVIAERIPLAVALSLVLQFPKAWITK